MVLCGMFSKIWAAASGSGNGNQLAGVRRATGHCVPNGYARLHNRGGPPVGAAARVGSVRRAAAQHHTEKRRARRLLHRRRAGRQKGTHDRRYHSRLLPARAQVRALAVGLVGPEGGRRTRHLRFRARRRKHQSAPAPEST